MAEQSRIHNNPVQGNTERSKLAPGQGSPKSEQARKDTDDNRTLLERNDDSYLVTQQGKDIKGRLPAIDEALWLAEKLGWDDKATFLPAPGTVGKIEAAIQKAMTLAKSATEMLRVATKAGELQKNSLTALMWLENEKRTALQKAVQMSEDVAAALSTAHTAHTLTQAAKGAVSYNDLEWQALMKAADLAKTSQEFEKILQMARDFGIADVSIIVGIAANAGFWLIPPPPKPN